jgi:methyltransferase (TIGR00027 family)
MNAERASRTAMMVAYMRALADVGASHVPNFRDPTARVFLNAKWTQRLTKVERQVRDGRRGVTLAFARVAADNMALRTATIDAAVRAAVARGAKQVVILGAGLDGRAWRMSELANVRVFEVDHPATQAVKRGHLDALPPSIATVTFVPVDFERDSLDAALARAGHDPTRPTCWIWEGVVMYLTRDAMRSTLANVASRSAEGSTLIVNYHTALRRGPVRLLLRWLGEPNKSKWSPEEMAADLQAAGFRVDEDSGIIDWVKRFATGTIDTRAGRDMRIAVAHRRA